MNPITSKINLIRLLTSAFIASMVCHVHAANVQKHISLYDLKTEYKTNPLGLEVSHPRFFWKISSAGNGVLQSAYQIKAASSIEDLNAEQNLLWNTGKVESDQSTQIEYQGKKLESSQKVFWQVRVWDNRGKVSAWSSPAFFTIGLLNASDWKAQWIEPGFNQDTVKPYPSPLMRKDFSIGKKVISATMYMTAHGLYQAFVNGQKVTDHLFNPGWTSYHKRLQYQVYDVTDLFQQGQNAIGVVVGDGWYRGPMVWEGKKNLYGQNAGLLLQLRLEYADGSVEYVVSDNSWKSSTGAILKSEIYDGETYDANLEQKGWNTVGFNDQNWKNVSVSDASLNNLVASCGSPVRITEEVKPVQKITTPKGEVVFDFGQNLVGWVYFSLKGKQGSKIVIQHAEVLDQEGNFYTENIRLADQQDEYIFKGNGVEEYEPHFTFHGFRYIKILDYKGDLSLDNFTAKVIHSDMPETGEFTCSDTLINRLQKNIQWGLRGNFLDVPTDCPQRDERLGWTGDAQVFASTACFNVNAAPFYTKWMKDFTADQKADGSVPWVVPNVVENGGGTGWSDGYGATGWADAAVIIPWTVYQTYGDVNILKGQYESMKAWEEYMIRHSADRYIFDYGFHFGDWLSFAEYMSYNYNAPDYGYAGAHTDKDLIATAYFYYTTGLMEKIARLLGHNEDAERYKAIRPKIKAAFQKEFVSETGRLTSNTQTAYILALSFGIMPDDLKEVAAKRLADDVTYFGHLTTGFLGTPLICQALSDNGYPEVAYQLLFNKRYPSWLYPVTMGATTIWERWDGIRPDGSFQNAGMNSFNHYAYGAVGQWLYSRVAGIQIDESNPGYKHFVIKPILTDSLSFAKANYQSLYGEIESNWEKQSNGLTLKVSIPANTTASVFIPTKDADKITMNNKSLQKQKIAYQTIEDGYCSVELGSGTYEFKSEIK